MIFNKPIRPKGELEYNGRVGGVDASDSLAGKFTINIQ